MYEYELVGACVKLLRDLFRVQPGETVALTVDTECTMDVVDATAQAAVILGAKPLVMKMAAAEGCGKAADDSLPSASLIGALCATDVWIEFNNQWIFYSKTYDTVVETNKKLRYMNLVGANPDLIMRNIGKVDVPTLTEFHHKVEEVSKNAKHIRVTTPAGGNIEFDNCPGREFVTADGIVNPGEVKMMPGQVSWAPEFETINGTIVVDGTQTPPLGKVSEPIKYTVEKGKIVKVEGGTDAKAMADWLASFKDPGMYTVAHLAYGIGPGAKLSGDIVEDERVWGAVEWGFGNVGAILTSDIPGGIPAASHTDGICLNATVWLDGKLFLENGVVVGPTQEIIDLARKLGK